MSSTSLPGSGASKYDDLLWNIWGYYWDPSARFKLIPKILTPAYWIPDQGNVPVLQRCIVSWLWCFIIVQIIRRCWRFICGLPDNLHGERYMYPSDIRRHRQHRHVITQCLAQREAKGIYRLPQELIDEIIDRLASTTSATNLRAVALTCRMFLPRARSHIGSLCALWISELDAAMFVQCYLLSPDIASSTMDINIHFRSSSTNQRSLSIPWFTDDQILSALQHFTNVRRLSFSRLLRRDLQSTRARHILMTTFASVRELHLSTCKFEDIHDLASFMGSFPLLEAFNLSNQESTWICDCSNHCGRVRSVASYYRPITPPPPSLQTLYALLGNEPLGNIADIVLWLSVRAPATSLLADIMGWYCTFKGDEFDHTPLFKHVGASLDRLSLKWDHRLVQRSDLPSSSTILFWNVNLTSLAIDFRESFSFSRAGTHDYSYFHDPSAGDDTNWLCSIISNIVSKQLRSIRFQFRYFLDPSEESFTFDFLHLKELDDILGQNRFKSTSIYFDVTIKEQDGAEYIMENVEGEARQLLLVSMPKAAQRDALHFHIYSYISKY